MNESVSPAGFPTTHWSRVVAAGEMAEPGASEALAELCAAYWFPLYAYIRRKGNGPEQALDLTQEYFARLLERGTVAAADPARGRFRALRSCSKPARARSRTLRSRRVWARRRPRPRSPCTGSAPVTAKPSARQSLPLWPTRLTSTTSSRPWFQPSGLDPKDGRIKLRRSLYGPFVFQVLRFVTSPPRARENLAMAETRNCRKCGSDVPIQSPENFCPRCMLLAAMGSSSGTALPEDGVLTGRLDAHALSVLDTIESTIGSVPRVLLRDTDNGFEPPLVRPDQNGGGDLSLRYRIDGEIGAGGWVRCSRAEIPTWAATSR